MRKKFHSGKRNRTMWGKRLESRFVPLRTKDLSSHRDHVNTIISVCLASLANPPRNCVNEEVSVERGSLRLLSLCHRRSQTNFLRNVFCHNLECCRASHRKCWRKKSSLRPAPNDIQLVIWRRMPNDTRNDENYFIHEIIFCSRKLHRSTPSTRKTVPKVTPLSRPRSALKAFLFVLHFFMANIETVKAIHTPRCVCSKLC